MKFYCTLLVFYFFFNTVFAQEVIEFSNSNTTMEVGDKIEILEDKTNSLSVKEVIASEYFEKTSQKVSNLQISTSSFWIKLKVKNLTDEKNLILELPYPIIDSVFFYSILQSGEVIIDKTGEYVPLHERKYKHQNYIFDLSIPKNEVSNYLIKVNGSEQMQIPLTIGTSKSIFESLLLKDLIFGLYAGIILVMFFYNLFVYFAVKDKTYLYYFIYIVFVGLTQACLQGYAFKFLWPNSHFIANQSMIFAPALAGISALEFFKNFLQVKKHYPFLYKGLYIFIGIYILTIILGIFGFYQVSQLFIQLNGMIASVFILIIGYRIAQSGYRPAIFFLIAWSIFLASVIVFGLRNFDLLPYNNFTYYALQIGSGLEVILLSFALADRINILKKEKEESQHEALQALQENQKLIKEQNITLDLKVKARTEQLEKSNVDLEVAMKELKETQSQLVNSEKMASLGQLTAGIAHEINNPINFVSSSVKPLRRDIKDILNILYQYEGVNESNLKEKILEISKLKSDLDFEYVKEEIDSLINGIDEGASRTTEIIKGLKTFSRLDESDLKMVDINEGIESTIILLNSMIKGKIQIIKQYGDIPKIECYAGKLNQVFMNILNNAVHAINGNNLSGSEGKIIITTEDAGDNVVVRIKDNGTGISESVRSKIFDPFFTTKDVGEGTGLGLSIVYNIIKDHRGNIDVESEIGKGTEFIITLPKFLRN